MAAKQKTRHIDPARVPKGFEPDPAIPPLRIAMLRGEGDLVEEDIAEAFLALGHQIDVVRYVRRGGALTFEGAEDDLGKLADRIMRFGPHAIVCCNVEGIGLSGLFPALAEAEGIPLVAWLVDHPPRDITRAIPPESSFAWLASYDRSHTGSLRAMGYRHVHHLPLATHPWRFQSGGEPRYDIGYAGNLFGALVEGIRADLDTRLRLVDAGLQEIAREVVDAGIERLAEWNADRIDPWEWVREKLEERLRPVPEQLDTVSGAMAGVIAHSAAATQRRTLVREVDRGDLHVWGHGWEDTVAPERCHEPVPYAEIGSIYGSCRVNLSIGHVQSLDSVTQRVFDVPAAGGFVLSDYRPSLGDLFDIGSEIVVYNSPEEARELAERYMRDDAARETVVEKARRRVLNEHTYVHRIEALTRRILDTWPEVAERRKRRKHIAIASGGTGTALLGHLCNILTQSAAAHPGFPLLQAISKAPEGEQWLTAKEAAEALAQGDAPRALELYEKATHSDGDPPPHHPGASDIVLFDAGRACATALGHARALPWFQRAAERSPRHPLYWTAIAGAFLQQEDYERGRAALDRALALSPGFAPAVRLNQAFSTELEGVEPRWEGLLQRPPSANA